MYKLYLNLYNFAWVLIFHRGGFALPSLKSVSPNQVYGSGDTPTPSGDPMGPSLTIVSPIRAGQEHSSSLRNELRDFEKAELEEKMDTKEAKENRNKNKGRETAEKEQITDSIDVKESGTGTSEYRYGCCQIIGLPISFPDLQNFLIQTIYIARA